MTGRLFAVVGPSGAGKDTLMAAAAARVPALRLARRVITRPADAGGEDFDGVTEAAFQRRLAAGAFALHWQAHGLHYGIPAAIDQDLAAGRCVLFWPRRSSAIPICRWFISPRRCRFWPSGWPRADARARPKSPRDCRGRRMIFLPV